MLGSLRVRLPLIFLAGLLLAGLVTTAISVQLFNQFARDQTLSQLTRESNGIAELYSESITAAYGQQNGQGKSTDRLPPKFAEKSLERATGARIYWVGAPNPFPGQDSGLTLLPFKTIEWQSGTQLSFKFTPPGQHRTYLAIASPVRIGQTAIGAIVVATPKTEVRNRVVALLYRLALAGLLGLVVAGGLGVYFSRRVVRPVLQLSEAADEVAGGNYAVDVPTNAPGELAHLSERFGEMANRLAEAERIERHFLMSVSHELRTPLTAIRGHVAALLEGVVEDPGAARRLSDDGAGRGAEARAPRRRHPRPGQARHPSLHRPHRGGRHGAAGRSGVRGLQRRGAPPVDRLPARGARPAGDRLGRRPRAADRREPALECVPGDAGRRPDHARARPDERHRQRHGGRLGPGHLSRRSRSGCSGRSSPRVVAAPASAWRSRRSSRRRSAGGSRSTPRSGTARGSSSCCRRAS